MSWNDASPMKQSWPMRWTSRTSVGLKADLAQFLKIFDASADREIAGVVDGRFSSKRLSLLVVLLDAGFFVIDVQRGHDAVGDDAGAEPTRCAPDDLTVEHQAHLTGPAEIEVLPDHLLEEDASRHRLIEHLGERKLGLQDGERIAIAGDAITCTSYPLPAFLAHSQPGHWRNISVDRGIHRDGQPLLFLLR